MKSSVPWIIRHDLGSQGARNMFSAVSYDDDELYFRSIIMGMGATELTQWVKKISTDTDGNPRHVEIVNSMDTENLEHFCKHNSISINKESAIPYTWPVDRSEDPDEEDDFSDSPAHGTWSLSNGIWIHSIAHAANGLNWIRLYSVVNSDEGKKQLQKFKVRLDNWKLDTLRKDAKTKVLRIDGYSIQSKAYKHVGWDDVILPAKLKEDIHTAIFTFFKSKPVYEKLDLAWQRGILLAGPPGNGKTMLCKTIASEADVPFITLTVDRNCNDGALEYAFKQARIFAPSILCLEDIDRLFKSNSQSTLVFFLNLLDGIYKSNDGVLVLATANHPEDLDQALVQRPSRFDRIFRIEVPLVDERFQFLMNKNVSNFFSQNTLESIAHGSDKMSMAFIQEIITQAHLNAVHRGEDPTDEDLQDALEALRLQNRTATKMSEDQGMAPVGFG